MLPFTRDEFLGVFARYHDDTWPAIWLVYLGGAAVTLALLRGPTPGAKRWALAYLGAAWLWMGSVYHWSYFREINPAAAFFGAFFVAQALSLALHAVWPRRSGGRRPAAPLQRRVSGALIVYALAIYPVLGALLGHAYPRGPSFGLPCPTTLFTLAVLPLVAPSRRALRGLLVIPVGWSLVATLAALELGIVEDWLLLPSALLTLGLAWRREPHGLSLTAQAA